MTAGVSVDIGRRPHTPTREELRRQLLALVLAFVLVWYTFVVPASAAAGSYNGAAPDDEGSDGEVRVAGGASRPAKAKTEKAKAETADELDWPEYIYP